MAKKKYTSNTTSSSPKIETTLKKVVSSKTVKVEIPKDLDSTFKAKTNIKAAFIKDGVWYFRRSDANNFFGLNNYKIITNPYI